MGEPGFTLTEVRLCIIGLGLMGGSLAKALHSKVARITAQDLDPAVIEAALADGAIDEEGTPNDADIIILGMPSHRIVETIQTLDVHPGQLVMDLGSTKQVICEAFDGLPDRVSAVGGHPMCGLAENGYHNAIPTLYRGARFVLCETVRTTPQARQQAEALVCALDAIPLWIDRRRHDALTAMTSHLPHLLNFALMRLAMDIADEDPDVYKLAAGGFDGATRLARTDESMLVGMFGTNAAEIRALTRRLRQHLDALEAILDDEDALRRELPPIVEARRQYSDDYGERPIA
jgi:prephenate dehydrogenase